MSDEALKRIEDALTAQAVEIASMKKVIETAPVISEVKAAAHVEVTKDPADVPFASLADQFRAVKMFTLTNGQQTAPRLRYLDSIKVGPLGGNESIPAEGGFLIDPTLTSEILMPMHDVGPFTSAVRRLPVGTNSNFGWLNGVNEVSRVAGSRWGGVLGYRMAEAGTKTPTKPAFRRINWELKKFAVLVYGTDELLQDAAMFSTVVRTGASEELSFMANDDILNGDGAAGPFGILQAPCLVSVAKEANQTADTIVYENLLKMWARILPRSASKSAWYVNSDCKPQLHKLALAVGTAALPAQFVSYANDGGLTIFGRPVIVNEFSATIGDQGDIMLADMSEYLFWEKGGVQEASSIHVAFLTDETVFRLVYRCDGQPALNAPLTPYKGSATQSPFVVLDAR